MKPFLRWATALVLLFAALPALAQQEPSSFAIQGRVVDAASGAPVEGAELVARLEGDGESEVRGRSGAEGRFRLAVPSAGRYTLTATHQGRIASVSAPLEISAEQPLASAGDLRLAAVVALEGLQVKAERPPVIEAEDRTIYSVQEMPAVSGGAADVMRTLPELEVDIDGNVKMVGGRGVTIHINGRPSPLKGEALTEFIKNLPADRIEKIEVIPNPSVRFEGGESAIVNITLKRGVRLGLSGSASLNGSTRGGNGLSGQVAYQRGKFTIFGGGSGRLYQMDSNSSEIRENLFANPITVLDQTNRSNGISYSGGGDLTLEYEMGEQATLWASGGSFDGGWKGDSFGHYRLLDASRSPLRIYERTSKNNSGYGYSNASVGYRKVMEPQRHELSAELQYNRSGNGNDGRIREETLQQAEEGALPQELRVLTGDEGQNSFTAKADYTRPLGKGGRVEVGVRAVREESDSDSRMRTYDSFTGTTPPIASTGTANRFTDNQREGYVNLSQKLGKLSLQGGLRAEHSARDLSAEGVAERFERSDFALFPSANANYDFGRGRSLRVSYSKRVRRPWIWDLNPYRLQTDPLNRYLGNPELEPSSTHSLNLDLSWRTQFVTLRLSPNVRRTTDEIEYMQTVDANGVSTRMPQNLATVTSWGGSLNASARPVAGSNISMTVGGSWMERDAGGLGSVYSGRGSYTYFNTNASMQVRRGASMQASMRVSGPRETPTGRYGSNVYSDLGFKQNLFGDKASLDLRFTDPFDVYRFSFVSKDPSFNSSGSNRSSWGARSASVSLTYRFGRMPQKKSSDSGPDGPPMPGGGGPGM